MSPSRAVPFAMVGLIIAAPVAAWWLIGDLTSAEAVTDGVERDYAHRAMSFGAAADRVIGVLACVAMVSTAALLLWATVTRRLRPRWWLVVVPLVSAGFLVSYFWRVSTAGVIGANIGAALLTFLVGPVVLVLLAVAAVAAWRLRRGASQPS